VLAASNLELGSIYYLKGRYEDAAQACERVLKLDKFEDSHSKAKKLRKKIRKHKKNR
jgi:hypothetical protein